MAHIVVIGAGIMGLAAAYQALLDGNTVEIFETAPQAGGMAAHFNLGDFSTERFYHFICKTDTPTFALLDELGLRAQLHWVPTTMGYFFGEKVHRWGDPISLLRFPHLNLIEKFRYGLLAFVAVNGGAWRGLEHQDARSWILRWCGKSGYEKMWRRLFEYKFYDYTGNISAAWIRTRMQRLGHSRRSLMQEVLGYIDGGSETLVNALVADITKRGGVLHLASPVDRVECAKNQVRGVTVHGKFTAADAVISTVPTPFVSAMVPDLPAATRAQYDAIANIGVVCVALRLRKSVSPHFWVNINADGIDIPGIIEFSNLRSTTDHVVYVPYYMPTSHAKWQWQPDQFITEAMACIRRINPHIGADDLLASHAARLRYAQPICQPGFAAKLPPAQTPIAGLQVADTCFYYPEDRGLAESIRLGRQMAVHLAATDPAPV